MGEIVNLQGGTIDRPCPTTWILRVFVGDKCDDADYRSWHLAARRMNDLALDVTWAPYAEVRAATPGWQPDTDPVRIGMVAYMAGYNDLPDPSEAATPEVNRLRSEMAMTLMLFGDKVLSSMQDYLRANGVEPPEIVSAASPAKARGKPWPWWAYFAVTFGVGGLVGAGGYAIATRPRRRRRRRG